MTEAKTALTAFCLFTIGFEVFLLTGQDSFDLQRSLFTAPAILFFLLYTCLEQLFKIFVNTKIAGLFAILPGILLFFLLFSSDKWLYASTAVLLAALAHLAFSYLPFKNTVLLWSCFVLDAVAVYLWFVYDCFIGNFSTDKLLFVSLVILTLSSLQQLIFEKNKGAFPFHYFLLLGLLLLALPSKDTPIDWTPVEAMLGKVASVSEGAYYFFDDLFKGSGYTTGYSSFNLSGGKLATSERAQLILTTNEKPYFVFTDSDSNSLKKIRRTMYLAGGKGVDKQQLVDFLLLLHQNNIDKEYAAIFSQISQVDIEYVYLNTPDEIAPACSISLLGNGKRVVEGVGSDNHKKGYKLNTVYLDIDYGSPYLIDLLEKAGDSGDIKPLSYKDAVSYMDAIYDIDLSHIMDESEYDKYVSYSMDKSGSLDEALSQYLEIADSNGKLSALAKEITENATNDYQRCKLIESYLRQFPYTTDAVGGYSQDSTMDTPEGMADIADRFLFDSKEGYCVHYTSSMITLLRQLGIPARAVSGYHYSFPFDQQEEYVVSASCAHVWPEAYIQNVGWVPFEPTSAYATASECSWNRRDENETASNDIGSTDNSIDLYHVPPVSISDSAKEKDGVSSLQLLKIIGAVLGSILLLLALIILGTKAVRRLRYHFATPAKRLKLDVDMIKATISKQSGAHIADRGLLSDYLCLAPEELQTDVQKAFDLYYKMVYGSSLDSAITPEESAFVKNVREKLNNKNLKLNPG